jgi:hypothetical protein
MGSFGAVTVFPEIVTPTVCIMLEALCLLMVSPVATPTSFGTTTNILSGNREPSVVF